ncbi:MAG TPA: transcription termination/antitermination protein NusA [Candidatus Kaiserbacteria bacterium]|nr:transcription termination/antitermination protein NusA [Candidatus Kaiserbacteria bacterium]
MIDLKTIHSVLGEFEDRGITKETVIEAIETALATAYKKEYGKRGQVIRSVVDLDTGTIIFEQIKTVVDDSIVQTKPEDADDETKKITKPEDTELPYFDPEKHILLENAQRMKRDAAIGDDIAFSLEPQEDFGRIAAQTAKQVIIQKIREAEKFSILEEFAHKKGELVSGIVQKVERGSLYIDLGRTTGIMPYEEQIPGERYRTGERLHAYLYMVDEGFRGVYLRLSRASAQFVVKLFELETPELASGTIEIKDIAREAGSRTKIAVVSLEPNIDPVGSLVGQRGVRVSTVIGELSGERIDIIEWSQDTETYIKEALSPASVISVELIGAEHRAVATVSEDQQSLAIGRGGQNVRLAAKLTGWNIDIISTNGNAVAESDEDRDEIGAGDPAKEAGLIPAESPEILTPAQEEMGEKEKDELPAEEELTEDEGNSIVDKEESRDKDAEDE